ncbi:MAG: thioredoxin family protein [Flavobacteriales bacterium]|nr:thioredoxin family protein [Flavobacteriales bacterium]
MALTSSNLFPLGTIAPNFELPDTISGKLLSLNALKGKNGTVIMFICNHCPFVIHINEQLIQLAKEYQNQGISIIAISSNDVERYPQDGPIKMKENAKRLGYPFPYLYDESQAVALAYDAACTPDFYVFDANLKSTYHGQLDDARPGNDKAIDGKDLRAAILALLNNKMPIAPQKPSIGCGIKWKQ